MSLNLIVSVIMACFAVADMIKGNIESSMMCVVVALQFLILSKLDGRKSNEGNGL